MIRTDLGAISAYAIAVSHGYTGTEAEFAEQIANAAGNAQRAENAAEDAGSAATDAIAAKNDVLNSLSYIRESYGYNLFNFETVFEHTFIDGSTGEESYAAAYDASDYIPVNGGATYYIRAFDIIIPGDYYRIGFYQADKTYIPNSRQNISINSSSASTFTTPSTAGYARVLIRTEYFTAKSLVFANGPITEYVPYYTAVDRIAREALEDAFYNYKMMESGKDFNTLHGSGSWFATSDYTYYNSPFNAGLIIQFETLSARQQIMLRYSDGSYAYRRALGDVWSDWIIIYSDTRKPSLMGGMFGDSLTYGAVWPEGGEASYQAPSNDQIPIRVGHAMGLDQMINRGVGGIGFVNKEYYPDYTIGELIKISNLSLYDVVVIAGGRNDSSVPLGTKTSAANDGTICGAVKDIINYIQSTYPSLQIIWVQTTPNTYYGDPFTGRTGGGWSLNDMEEQIGALCAENNVPYITWKEWSPIKNWATFVGANNVHPTTSAIYRKMGCYIGGKAAQYYHC